MVKSHRGGGWVVAGDLVIGCARSGSRVERSAASPFAVADAAGTDRPTLLVWEHEAMGVFQRFHAGYVGRTGAPVGVFVAVDHLRRTGRLSEEEIVLYAVVDDWFQENLPNPSFYDDGNSIGAVTWFRHASEGMTDRLRPLLSILDSKGVAWERSVSDNPGRVVYEDQWQVGVIPSSRLGMTPLPYPGKLGPSDWFKVRKGILSIHRP